MTKYCLFPLSTACIWGIWVFYVTIPEQYKHILEKMEYVASARFTLKFRLRDALPPN